MDEGSSVNGDANTAQRATGAAGDAAPEAEGALGDAAERARAAGLDELACLDAFLDWQAGRGRQLWPHQEDACLALAAGDHVILGTPTGSGKSTVALMLAFLALATGRRMYYTAPIKALVSEKFFDFASVLGRDRVGMITGDVALNAEAPVVCCTAEILANDALRFGPDARIAFAAMDEFHFFGDPQRGWAWQVPLLALPHTRFLLMSATLGDTAAIAGKLRERTSVPVTTIDDAPRPVPLEFRFADQTTLEGTVELALREGLAPVYIVHFAQDAALKSAQSLASFGVSSKEQREAVKAAIAGVRFTTAFGKTLKRLLLMGVGVHHAGMLPRYRRCVEQLAQAGLLPVICGTDTLGVGINVPIRCVLLTALAKFDGTRARRLNAREFHQIAGRAGRAGFDAQGTVIAQATEYDVERNRALAKAGGDAKRARKVKTAKPPEGFVGWDEGTFKRLVEARPEPLRPRMRMTHAMVLAEVMQGGPAWERAHELVDASLQPDAQKDALHMRADEVFATLEAAGIIAHEQLPDGAEDWFLEAEMPDRFALDQPLSPFLLAALELLDPASPTYALDVVSMAEATLEDPRQILRAQERAARDAAMAAMKAEGVDYEERLDRIQEVTYPKPLDELLGAAFEQYRQEVPWADDFALSPKSVLRDMVEAASDFKSYVQRYGLSRCEGIVLRYLSDAWRVLDRTVPPEFYDERLDDIVCWLGWLVRSIDSSLFDEWAGREAGEADAAAPGAADAVVADRRGVTLLVRNALFARVRLIARDDAQGLGALDGEWGWPAARWQEALDGFYAEHRDALTDADARSAAYFRIDERDEAERHVWHAEQTVLDDAGDLDFRIWADVDLDATQERGEAVFADYRFGPFGE